MIAFIFFMSVAYVLIKLLLDVFDIEFYSLFNNYSQDKVEYLTRDIVLGVSLVFGIVGALVAVKLKYGEKLYLVFCSFIGVLQLIGLYENFVGAQIDTSQGSWEDFFIPLLHMEYNFRGQGIILAGVMIVGSFILYIIQSVILNDNRED